ncbi:retrovirus-related pol polyprotein from transposon TNT 1-94 [Tanacetum coccineum]
MATTDKESSAASTDNRPPMLEESDFESWKIRIERYIRGKPLGKLIWKSIKNGPIPHPTIIVTTGEGEQQTQVTREKTDEEFTKAENNKERADIQATNILSQGLPRHIFNTLNQTETEKEIWENVELLMQGSGLTEQQKKETLFDQYERFRANRNESIYDYLTYLRIGATKATQSTSSPSQYVPPLSQYAPASQQAPQSTNDVMLATMNQIVNLLTGQITTESVQRRAPGNKGKHAATGSQGKVVTCYNCHGQGHVAKECKENKRSKDSQWFNEKALLMEAKEKGATLDAEAEAFLADVKCITPYAEPLAITTTTKFEVSHEDAYDSNVDEAPHAAAAFMANLMQTGPSTGQGTSNDTDFHSEVHNYDNHFFDNMNLQVSREIHGGEQLDFDVDSVIDDYDNTIPYHQYQLNNEVKSVPTDVSSVIPECEKLKVDKNALEESYLEELVWLRNTNKVVTELLQSYGQPVQTVPMLSKRPTFSTKDLHKSALGHRNPLVYDSEETLVQAEVSRTKMLERMKDPLCKVSSKPKNYAKLNSLYDTFVPQKQLFREHVYWLPANEVASYNCNQSKPVTNFVRTRRAKVLAPGLYAMTPKYIPPQKRNNREANTPLPRKEIVSLVKKTNVITKPEVVPLEKSRSVSTSEPANNVIVTPSWVRFLRTKDETPEVIKKFIILMQRALNAIVRYLRTDNGTSLSTKHSHGSSGKKPKVKYFWVFGSLCYPTNDYDDLGKLKAKVHIGHEINKLQSRRISYVRVTTLTTPSVPLTEKQLSKLFQPLFDDDEEFPPDVHPHLVYVAPPRAPKIAPDSPSMTMVTEDAPATTTITSPSQISTPNTGVNGPKNTITTSGSESFENSVTNEFDSEASSSGTINVNPTLQNNPPIVHGQKWTKDHPLENVIGDLNRPISTRRQLETDAIWCFFNEFLENVEPKKFKEAVQYPCWIDAMQEEIHKFECLVVWELVPASSHSLVIGVGNFELLLPILLYYCWFKIDTAAND